MKEGTCGHMGPQNNWKERTGCLPNTTALWASWESSLGELPSVAFVATLFLSVCQVVKTMLYPSSLWSHSWVLPQAVTFREPLYASRPHKAGKTARKKSAQMHQLLGELRDEIQPPSLGEQLAQHREKWLTTSADFSSQTSSKTEKNSKADQTTDSFCRWLKYHCFPELTRLKEDSCFSHWRSCRNCPFLDYQQ